MWISILFAVLIEIIPKHLCSLVIGIFLFVMNNVGGNLPVVIDPLSKLIGYREVLYIFYPGGYLLSQCFRIQLLIPIHQLIVSFLPPQVPSYLH